MIALRKDVKVGFVIGGIVLGVFGVYLGLSALAGEKPDNSMTGANLQLTPFGTQPTPTSVADRTSKSLTNPSNASKSQSQIKSGPAIANPSQPINVADSSGNDIWGNAFETGKLQPVVTVTPDANRLSAVTPRPADVISAIRKSGPGWTGRVNDVLSRSVKTGQFAKAAKRA